jgi:hypothetical protein
MEEAVITMSVKGNNAKDIDPAQRSFVMQTSFRSPKKLLIDSCPKS